MSFLAELNELNYVPKAEEVIQSLRVPEKNGDGYKLMLTTSKIRNLLSMITDIYNTVSMRLDEKLDNDILGHIQYLKMRFAYEAGRDNTQAVRKFVEKAEIFKHIDEIQTSRSQLLIFCRYMEALVAYHKFYGGRD
jgi:CRISPR-associated protein Csm2